VLLGTTPRKTPRFRLPDSHRLRPAIPNQFGYPKRFITPPQFGGTRNRTIPQPRTRNTRRLSTRARFSLLPFRSPLLRESLLFSSPTGTKMFHFPASPPTALYIQTAATPHNECQVTPFGNPRITAWLPAPRGISQAPTSFIGP
jgi:hypothetical protein